MLLSRTKSTKVEFSGDRPMLKRLVGCLLSESAPAAWYRSTIRRMTEAGSVAHLRPLVGVCQMTATSSKEENLAVCVGLIQRACARGAKMVFLPEACDYIADSKEESMKMAEPIDGNIISRYLQVAKELNVWISIGGFHQKGDDETGRVRNTHVLVSSDGQIMAAYDKCHLFDLDIKNGVRLCESDYTIPGGKILPPVQSPVGKVGLATCYDVRFPEMSIALCSQGAELLTYPSAFTQTTGMAHWEVLLRSRAVESQCYVLAAAQTGRHNAKRSSYGHAMIVDPWGRVLSQCGEGADVCVAEINLDYLRSVRDGMPVSQHRRHDLYSPVQLTPASYNSAKSIEDRSEYEFGQHKVASSCVFYRTPLSFAFVNIKPLLPGHVLVSPVRVAARFGDLEGEEVADLFRAVQEVTRVIERQYEGTSATVAIQDGPQAGQTVQHLHVHILPRKKGDFDKNDDIYSKLEENDASLGEGAARLRSVEEMRQEAGTLRLCFNNS